MRFRLEVRLTPADVGQRVVIRWRRPAPGGGEAVADVLGVLEEADGCIPIEADWDSRSAATG